MNLQLILVLLCIVSLHLTPISAINLSNFGVDDVLEVLIPTTTSNNEKCRNDSIFYVQELKQLKLWATEMFDSSSKFPTGVLAGSNFDLGHFDECIDVKIETEFSEEISGRYCIAKFHVTPPDFVNKQDKFYYRFYENEGANLTSWEKIAQYSKDRSRNTRNDFHLAFCIPSSCHREDLETSLKNIAGKLNSFSEFTIDVSVDQRHCQTKTGFDFSSGDIAFMCILGILFLIAICATIYDWLIKLDDLKNLRLSENQHKLVMAFSLWTNLKKLNKRPDDKDRLQCIHGMKVISMFLIIMGHRIMFGIGSPILNPNFVENMYGKIETSVLLNGPIIVDTFFNISGFLACYLMLTEIARRGRGVNFIVLYIHRFIRLTPAYAIVLAFYCTIFVKLGSGPFWLERVEVEQERCLKSWWANLIYVNNYINTDNICMFQSWYMTCDMHFFIIAPFIVWLLRKKIYVGLATLVGLIVVSLSVVFALVYINNEDGILLLYMKLLRDPVVNNTFKNVYIPTHMRASPYIVGMITGYLKYKMRSSGYKMPKYMVYMGWLMCVLIIEVTVYSAFIFYVPDIPYDPFLSATYAAMHHFTWSICISWMIIAISEGNGAWIEPLLTWKPLILLSRITYTAFLCHGAIQIYSAATIRQPYYTSIFNLMTYTCADITLAYIAGLILSMIIEAPILALEKILLKKHISKPQRIDFPQPNCRDIVPKIKIIDDE